MGIVTTGQFSIVDVNDGVNLRMTQDSCVISTETDGSGGDYSLAGTSLSVMLGQVDDTANWAFQAFPSGGLTGSLVGNVWITTDLVADAGFVDFVATKQGQEPLTARFMITKALRGHLGPTLSIIASAAGFVFKDGVAYPSDQVIALTLVRSKGVTGQAFFYASNGSVLPTDLDVYDPNWFMFGWGQPAVGDTCYVSLASFSAEEAQMYVTGTVGNLSAVATIGRINFSTAEPGATRNVFRGPWLAAQAYAAGDMVLDDGNGWAARSDHISDNSNRPPVPPLTQNAWWEQAMVKGDRGTLIVSVPIPGTSWSDAAANDAIVAAGGVAPLRGDVVTEFNSAQSWSQTRVRLQNGTWAVLAAFFGGDVLVDGTLAAGKLVANSLTTAQIQAGGVNADRLMAGTITAGLVAAGAIAVRHMSVTDLTNMLAGSETAASSSWTFNNGTSFATDQIYGGRASSIKIMGSGTGASTFPAVAVSSGEQFYVELMAYRGSSWNGTSAGSKLRFADQSNNEVFSVALGTTDMPVTTWTKLSGVFTVPSGVSALNISIVENATTGSLWLSDMVMRRRAQGILIVDGAIQAIHMSADSVSAGALQANAVHTRHLAIGDSSRLFSATFDSDETLNDWSWFSGAGEMFCVLDPTSTFGGRAMQIGDNSGIDHRRIHSKRVIPFDPTKTYRISIRAKRPAGTGGFSAGFIGYAADGTTYVNYTGANDAANHYYHAANNLMLGTDYQEVVGYTRGYGIGTGSAGVGTIETPGTMHPDVRYIVPVMVANLTNKTGITMIDSFVVEVMTGATLIEDGAILTRHLTADSVETQHLKAKSITVDKLLVGDTTNLLADFSQTGSLAGWGTNGFQSLTYVADNEAAGSGWRVQCNDRDNMYSDEIPVVWGRQYHVEAYAHNKDSSAPTYIGVNFLHANGTYTYWGSNLSSVVNAWSRMAGVFTVPSGAISMRVFLVQNKAHGAGGLSCHWMNARLRYAVTGEIITGSIRSDNYNPGSSGWNIDKNGNAEFNNLINRSAIQLGAVSDTMARSWWDIPGNWGAEGWTNRDNIDLTPSASTDMWLMYFNVLLRSKSLTVYTGQGKGGYETFHYQGKLSVNLNMVLNGQYSGENIFYGEAITYNGNWIQRSLFIPIYRAFDAAHLAINTEHARASDGTALIHQITVSAKKITR